MAIPASIRVLYRSIGNIIGNKIADRIKQDTQLNQDQETRETWAKLFIKTITELRGELAGARDFDQVAKVISKLEANKDNASYIKLLAWIIEAYLLLNQSSTACAEVTKPYALLPERVFAAELIKGADKELASILADEFSANLVLTAHPTAGIQPDYIHHIKAMVETIQEMSYRIDPESWSDFKDEQVEDLLEDLSISISHMVRAKPYNSDQLRPVDESRNFLDNLAEAWDIIPANVQAVERELCKTQGKEFKLSAKFFKLHSWVARDIDGNPSVSEEEHLGAIFQERIHFLTKYRLELDKLWQNYGDDFTNDKSYPMKTFFVDDSFKALYDELIKKFDNLIVNPHQAYRVVIHYGIVLKIEVLIDKLLKIDAMNSDSVKLFASFDVQNDIIAPLELIRANKVTNASNISTKEIDILIRKAKVFGDFGSQGHTRQGADILAKLTKYLTALWDGQVANKTNYVMDIETVTKSAKPIRLFSDYKPIVNYQVLRNKITIQFMSETDKAKHKLLQTFDLLVLAELGAIKRQIISMNSSFEDMLNVLVIAKTMKAFSPALREQLPLSRLEIVPLTEQICDLRNSYRVTIDALTNPAWHQYLISQDGRFIKMRGPSDSGKQNGFTASQWEMFRSKQLDTIVVKIFNAYLRHQLDGDSKQLDAWRKLASGAEFTDDEQKSEIEVIAIAVKDFDEFFDRKPSAKPKVDVLMGENCFDKILWKAAGLKEVKMINFDGWGEPVERGGGLEFRDTVKCTQPTGSIAYYERTLQGGGAQQLASGLRTKQATQDFISGVYDIAIRQRDFNQEELTTKKLEDFYKKSFVLDPKFTKLMNGMVQSLRLSLRSEVFGLDLDDDHKVSDETILRNYFRHVIKSPLVFLDLFNIASRPTSRSGSQLKEYLDKPEFHNQLDLLAEKLTTAEIVSILGDVRAIPYAAMFSLLGGNHVSFYGFGKLMANADLVESIKYFYDQDDSQESRLIKHVIDSLEKGIISSDQACYKKAHSIIEQATDANYKVTEDLLINKLAIAEQETMNFVALIKNYQIEDSMLVKIEELMQDQPDLRDLLIARRNDAAVPRLAIALAMSEILKKTQAENSNPLDRKNIPENMLDLLRKAFAAGASTFGNGCID
ncbi:MAG: phosphoenolpyruvate carboxylase [Cyanobacteria bacterium]|nr:phosphoenolpyruvate carboxylase [Cyanobacteriota bacterium]MDA1021529.1 phosphoenolpyruvate carboxylase [Cyanobacteriota bacterium]